MKDLFNQFHNPLKGTKLPDNRRHPAFWLAVWFGAGLTPLRGPAGALVALPIAYILLLFTGQVGLLLATLIITVVGIWASAWFNKATATKDGSPIVIDEVAGMLLTCTFLPITGEHVWLWWIWAYMVFNLLDYLKPWPANVIENVGAGYGVMLDDIAAGFYAMFIVWGVITLYG